MPVRKRTIEAYCKKSAFPEYWPAAIEMMEAGIPNNNSPVVNCPALQAMAFGAAQGAFLPATHLSSQAANP